MGERVRLGEREQRWTRQSASALGGQPPARGSLYARSTRFSRFPAAQPEPAKTPQEERPEV